MPARQAPPYNLRLIDCLSAQAYQEQIMAVDPSNLVLEHLRAMRSEFDGFRADMRDVKGRLTSLEVSVTSLRAELANLLVKRLGNGSPSNRVQS